MDLTVERKVIFILLQENLCQQRRSGYSLVDWEQGHGRYFNGLLSAWRKCRIVFQTILGTYYFLDIQLSGLMFHDTGHFFTNLLVQVQVNAVRFNYYTFQNGKVFHHLAVLPLTLPVLSRFLDSLHGNIMRFLDFRGFFRNLSTEQVKLVRIKRSEFFRLTPKELTVQPCDLCRQLINTFLKGGVCCGQGGYCSIQCLYRL